MANPLEEHAWQHRANSHQNGTKIVYFSQADCNWIIAHLEGRLSDSQPAPADDSQRQRQGAGAGARRRVPVQVPAPPVVQEPEYKFSKKVGTGWSGAC